MENDQSIDDTKLMLLSLNRRMNAIFDNKLFVLNLKSSDLHLTIKIEQQNKMKQNNKTINF